MPFFPKSGDFFLSRCAPVSVAEYASVSLNMPKYPRKWLNKLFWLCQGSEYACSSYMFGRFLKIPPVLNKPGFWIWLYMPQYALMSLNTPEHGWILMNVLECMNIAEYARINYSDYGRVLNMPRYRYNIIDVTKVIRLEFLSATILSFFKHKLEHKNNEN